MNIIAVIDNKWGIGRSNGLLFNIPEDMAFFRETTKGKVVVMGKNTFFSLNQRSLKNRTNIVLSSNLQSTDNVTIAKDLPSLMKILKQFAGKDIFVIGGAQLYNALLDYCDTAYITKVDADGGAEVFIENLDNLANWQCVDNMACVSQSGYSLTFCTYINKTVKEF